MSPRRKVLTIAALFIATIGVSSVFYLLPQNKYGKEVEFQNLNDFTKEKPKNRDSVSLAQHLLFDMIDRNSGEKISSRSIKDALVREGSFKQSFDDALGIHRVEFIADIESLQQSYGVSYEWADTKESEGNLDQYGTLITCLPEDQLIYDTFACIDVAATMRGTTRPTLAINWSGSADQYGNSIDEQILPFEQVFAEYQILGNFKENSKLSSLDITSEISNVHREVLSGNTLSFEVLVDQKNTYTVSIDFNDGRLMKISSADTDFSIERKTELLD